MPRILGNRHPTVQDVEGKTVLAAHEWPDLTLEDRNLLGAIQTGNLEGASAQAGPR
jgi:hypothetical protein